jgi:RNA polymerase sigma-70 factor (ECF subfamily)
VQREDTSRDRGRLRRAKLVDAFLAAARSGDFSALVAVLDPDVVLRADHAAVQMGAAPETRGAAGVAEFSRRASGARRALLDGAAAAVWMRSGRATRRPQLHVGNERIVAIDLIADPARVHQLDLEVRGD